MWGQALHTLCTLLAAVMHRPIAIIPCFRLGRDPPTPSSPNTPLQRPLLQHECSTAQPGCSVGCLLSRLLNTMVTVSGLECSILAPGHWHNLGAWDHTASCRTRHWATSSPSTKRCSRGCGAPMRAGCCWAPATTRSSACSSVPDGHVPDPSDPPLPLARVAHAAICMCPRRNSGAGVVPTAHRHLSPSVDSSTASLRLAHWPSGRVWDQGRPFPMSHLPTRVVASPCKPHGDAMWRRRCGVAGMTQTFWTACVQTGCNTSPATTCTFPSTALASTAQPPM